MKNLARILAALVLALMVLACGGGGGDADEVRQVGTAEGFWEGNSSTGFLVSLAILENGETWGVYTSQGLIVGALHGNTAWNGTSLAGSGRDFNIPSRSVLAESYSGTFTPKGTINVTTAPSSVRFAGAYKTAYDQPASLAALAGTFSGKGVSGTSSVQSITVVISPSGVATVAPTLGCSAAGTVAPRATGKNVFNVTVTFTGSNCALGNGTTTVGVAYFDTVTRRVIVMAMNAAKSDGFVYVGQK